MVMAGLASAIRATRHQARRFRCMPGTRPGMTILVCRFDRKLA
jgi:hypothetical protein